MDFDIQLSRIVFPFLVSYGSLDDLAGLQCGGDVFPMVDQEHTLAPVGVWAGGAGGECHALAVPGPLFCSGGGGHGVVSCGLEEGVEPDDEAV